MSPRTKTYETIDEALRAVRGYFTAMREGALDIAWTYSSRGETVKVIKRGYDVAAEYPNGYYTCY